MPNTPPAPPPAHTAGVTQTTPLPPISASDSTAQTVGRASDGDEYVEGVVVEVLVGFGLAHVKTDDGRLLGVSRAVIGQHAFEAIYESQLARLRVQRRFARVISFEAL